MDLFTLFDYYILVISGFKKGIFKNPCTCVMCDRDIMETEMNTYLYIALFWLMLRC